MTRAVMQPSFARGELAPALYGRVDLAVYAIALKTATNFIVRPYGGVDNRPGTQFIAEVKNSANDTRLIPFTYSTSVTYVIEAGPLYMRFFSNGGAIEVADVPVEVVTPWSASQTGELSYTQSADVMTFAQGDFLPYELSRTSATAFSLAVVATKEGPFRDLNPNEEVVVAVSGATGNQTLTANTPIFTAEMVGGKFYIENRNFSNIKPWTPGERGLALGDLRRSDGKTYKVVAIPSGYDWTETGGVRPLHERGRAWDGGGDVRENGSQVYAVGVEWEYQDSGFGTMTITAFTSSTSVSVLIERNVPAGCVGGAGVAANTWTFSADGTVGPYAIAGATGLTAGNYTVTINGVPVPSGFFSGGVGDLPRDGSGDYSRGGVVP